MQFVKSGNLRIAASLILLAMLIGVALVGFLPQFGSHFASANSSVVQHNIGNVGGCFRAPDCSLTINFTSDVTDGNVVVVVLLDNNPSCDLPNVTDSLSSTYALELNNCVLDGTNEILAATLHSSGSDSVTIDDSSGSDVLISAEIFEVSGVSTSSAQNATGSQYCSSGNCDVSTSSNDTFIPGTFLVSMFSFDAEVSNFTSGSGFTNQTLLDNGVYAEYSISGVTSPTDYPAAFTFTDPGDYYESAIALEPSVTVTATAPPTTSTKTQPTTTTTQTTTITSTISVYSTTTRVNCFPSKSRVHQVIDCTAIVSSRTTLPNGTISFGWSEGKIGSLSPPLDCVPVSGSNTKCSATIALSFPKIGTVVVTAAYSGDLTHKTSHAATIVHVVK